MEAPKPSIKKTSSAQKVVNWLWHLIPRESDSHKRRLTESYRRRKGKVKNLWICTGVVMLINPMPAFVVSMALVTTFLAFMILDEVD